MTSRRDVGAALVAVCCVVVGACTERRPPRPSPYATPVPSAPRPQAAVRPVPVLGGFVASSSGQLGIDEERLYFPLELARTRPAGSERVILADFEHDAPSVLRARHKAGGDETDLVAWPSRFGPDVLVEGEDVIFGKVGAFVPNPDACRPNALCSRPRFVVSATGAIASVPKRGGSERVLVGAVTGLERLAADADHVFFADGEAISRVSRAGGPPEILTRGVACNVIALAAAHVLCGTTQGLLRIGKAGEAGAVISSAPVLNHGLTVAGEVAFFGSAAYRPRVTPLPPDPNLGRSQGIGTGRDPRVEEIRVVGAVAVLGGASRTLVETSHVAFMVHDASSILWDTSAAIERVPFAGPTSTVATTGARLVGLAADATDVHWLDAQGRLGRAPR